MDGDITTVADFAGSPFYYPRGLIVGHDGAFRVIVMTRNNGVWWDPNTIVRVALDGTISSALSTPGPIGDVTHISAHPDGNYYICLYWGMRRLSPTGEISPSITDFAFQWQWPYLARDGFYYDGRYMPGSATGVSEIVRVRPNGTQEVVVDRLGYLLREPWIQLQSHRGD